MDIKNKINMYFVYLGSINQIKEFNHLRRPRFFSRKAGLFCNRSFNGDKDNKAAPSGSYQSPLTVQ